MQETLDFYRPPRKHWLLRAVMILTGLAFLLTPCFWCARNFTFPSIGETEQRVSTDPTADVRSLLEDLKLKTLVEREVARLECRRAHFLSTAAFEVASAW